MEIRLAENIKCFRKQKGLTQEQLAEVMGVSVGAVHKWEAGLSVPEIGMIIRLADFFDSSVDVLLGYQIKDNRHDAMVQRLSDYYNNKDRSGIEEAEKALKKYPNSFLITYLSANLYMGFGTAEDNREYLLRALTLLEAAEQLTVQNQDSKFGDFMLRGEKGIIYLKLGEVSKALEILKENNVGGFYDDLIGTVYAHFLNKPEDGAPYLSHALMGAFESILNASLGYLMLYVSRRDFASAHAFLDWLDAVLEGLHRERERNKADYVDASNAMMIVGRAYVLCNEGKEKKAKECMQKALAVAKRFDEEPNYDVSTLRFMEGVGKMGAYDIFGTTATESMGNMIETLNDPKMLKLWKEVNHGK